MINKLYIRKNLQKNISNYAIVMLIITISMVTINTISIYLDSVVYGSKLDVFEKTKGYHFWLLNSDENDLVFYKEIPNIEVEYENNIIYVKLFRENESDKVHKQILDTISENSLGVKLLSYSDLLDKPGDLSNENRVFNILKFVFTIVGTISICFIYMIFIEKKKNDLGILVSLGMNNNQLKKLLFAELLIIYCFSFLTALIFSNISMQFLIQNFLFVDNKNFVLASIVYKFSFSSTLLLFILSFSSVISAYFLSLRRILNISVIQTIREYSGDAHIKRNINIWNKMSYVNYIAKANITRNKKFLICCSCISIPVILVSVLFFNFFNLYNLPRDEYDFFIGTISSELLDNPDEMFDNIEKLKNVNGIKNIIYYIHNGNYLVQIDKTKPKLKYSTHTKYHENDSIEYYHTSLNALPDNYVEEHKENFKGEFNKYYLDNYIILPENSTSLGYKTGDEIIIYDRGVEKKTLTIAGFIDYPQNSEFLNIYVTKDNYENITGQIAVPQQIKVYLDKEADIQAVREDIYGIFADESIFKVTDNIKMREDELKTVQGMSFIGTFLCLTLFLCAIILLCAFIAYYITNQKSQIDILKMLGARRKTVIKIAVYESLAKGIINSCIGIFLGTLISYLVVKIGNYSLLLNAYLIITYGIIILTVLLAHVIPSYVTIKKITAEAEEK